MSQVRKIRLTLSPEAHALLAKGAEQAGMTEVDFAKVCIYSVLANYAQQVDSDSEVAVVAHHVLDHGE